MKQTQFDKHTIAWFKIAECVSRGEKERALGVYRLLSHSFNDNAVARQLEADIHLSFGERDVAISLYQQAMEWYQKTERYLEATAVCEHIITLSNDTIAFRREAIKLYSLMGNTAKMQLHAQEVLNSIILIGHEHVLQEFLLLLRGYSDGLHEYAVKYLNKF